MGTQRLVFPNALRIGSIRGIDIRIDASWLIIAALITWSFWGQFTIVYGQDGPTALAMAVIGALLFFSSVLAHELAHALEAQSRGVGVGGITLFLFGGVTESKFNVRRPVDEFALTIVGPLTSFALAGIFWGVSLVAQGGEIATVAQVAGLLGWINLALAVFNLIPGAPLDGGRILRAAVWKVTGDRRRSIRFAARAGQVVGAGLIGLGIGQVLFVTGGLFGGLWLALIGWFLRRGAAAELAQAELSELLGRLPAGAVTRRTPPVAAHAPLDEVFDRWVTGEDPELLPVVEDDRLVGVLRLPDVEGVDEADRSRRQVESVMVPIERYPTVDAGHPATEVLDALSDDDVVVAVDHGRPVGLIDAERLVAVAQRQARVAAGGERNAG
jgi:Zn-dependent protease